MSRPDDFWLEWAPDVHPLDLPSPSLGQWLRLADGIIELECARGYERQIGRIEVGELTAVVRNDTRALDPSNRTGPWAGKLGPFKHLRLRAKLGTTDYTVWSGYTKSFDIDWQLSAGFCTITATDSLVMLAHTIAESVMEDAIAALNPDIWLPLDDGGSTYLRGAGRSPGAVAYSTVPGDAILPYAKGQRSTSFKYTGASRADVQVPGGVYFVGGQFTVCGVFKAPAVNSSQRILTAGPLGGSADSPAGDLSFGLDLANQASIRVGHSGINNQLSLTQPHNEEGTLLVGTYDTSALKMTLEASVGQYSISLVERTITTGQGIAPRVGRVRIGAGLDTETSNLQMLGQISHVALWRRVLTAEERGALYRGMWGLVKYTGGDVDRHSNDVVEWALDQMGMPSNRRDIQQALYHAGGISTPVGGLELMHRAANNERGYFFANRVGTYVFRIGGQKGTFRGTYSTDPSKDAGSRGLADLDPRFDDRSFATVGKATDTRTDPEGVDWTYRHPNANVYGEIERGIETMFNTPGDAQKAAIEQVGKAEPQMDVQRVTVKMGAQGVVSADLLESDILDEATVIARIPGPKQQEPAFTWGVAGKGWGQGKWGPEPPYSKRCTILHVRHVYDQDNSWTTEWGVTPS